MPDDAAFLKSVRDKIDAIDNQLLVLLNQRASCALEVAKVKREVGEAKNFRRLERERTILKRLCESSAGPLDLAVIRDLFQRIIDACLALQQ